MPNSASAKKRVRQTDDRTLRNKDRRGAVRGSVKRLEAAIAAGDKAAAQAELTTTYQAIDKAAKKRVMHPHTAGNTKARLARRVNAIK